MTVQVARLNGSVVAEIITVDPVAEERAAGTIGLPVITEGVEVGWLWDGQAFHPPGTNIRLMRARRDMVLTLRQFLIGLVANGWISEAEGDAWAQGSALPALAVAVIAAMPTEAQQPARLTLYRMSEVYRTDPLLVAMAAHPGAVALGVTEAAIDTLFRTYANV